MNAPHEDPQYILNEYATQLRDIADQDYVAGRQSYRLHLDHQARWCSLQALEKLLKAILLFNGESTKRLSHRIFTAAQRVQKVPDLDFSMPDKAWEFVRYLETYGRDRYLSHSTHIHQEFLLELDMAVWYVRKYCWFMRWPSENSESRDPFRANVEHATNPFYEDHPQRFALFPPGFLEKVVTDRLPAYDALVWRNAYFGRIRKKPYPWCRFRASSSNPVHFSEPDVFDVLKEYVDFPARLESVLRERSS